MDRILRLPEVVKNTGLPKSTIYRKIAKNEFPAQRSLGAKSVGWKENEINDWIEARPLLSNKTTTIH